MTATTATLADFLLARIAEDEADAETAAALKSGSPFARDDHGRLLVDPARVLAECEAKRRIVERCAWIGPGAPAYHLASGILEELALPYADHESFREEWRV